jgi:hypothetical protein
MMWREPDAWQVAGSRAWGFSEGGIGTEGPVGSFAAITVTRVEMGRKTLIYRTDPALASGVAGKRSDRLRESMGLEMAGMMLKSWIVAGVACCGLVACEPGTGNGPVTEDAGTGVAAASATSVRLVDRDVEAPDVFQATDKALWDGRPSLGGVWIASPAAKNPERVIMRNPANGKFVIGGLFQRDASLPGPKLQLSSDAADALGLLAGQPAVISVTALRRDEAATKAPDASKPLLDANEAVQPGGKPANGPADVAVTAAAAIDKATGKPATKPGTQPTGQPTGQPAVAAVAPTPAKPGQKPAAQPVATETAAAAPAAPQGTGSLIQVGIFSVEANAKRAASVLGQAGVPAATTQETSHGKPLWSVTVRGDAALLAKIKGTGFSDAYVLKR